MSGGLLATNAMAVFARFQDRYLLRMVRHGLRGVSIRGAMPAGPFVWAANHHSWWDPFVAAATMALYRRRACLLMEQGNLQRMRFVRGLGVFGDAEPRTGLRYLAAGRPLVIFPEGELRQAGHISGLAPGAAWFARQARVPLLAVAVRVVLRGHQLPEAFVDFSPIEDVGSVPATTAALAEALSRRLADIDRLVATLPPRQPLPGFALLLRGRLSFEERIGRVRPGDPR
jgi:1-acyl-sn-glycerol-3-phosphate acyltransferase